MQHCVFYNRQMAIINALERQYDTAIILQSPEKVGKKMQRFFPKPGKMYVLAGQIVP